MTWHDQGQGWPCLSLGHHPGLSPGRVRGMPVFSSDPGVFRSPPTPGGQVAGPGWGPLSLPLGHAKLWLLLVLWASTGDASSACWSRWPVPCRAVSCLNGGGSRRPQNCRPQCSALKDKRSPSPTCVSLGVYPDPPCPLMLDLTSLGCLSLLRPSLPAQIPGPHRSPGGTDVSLGDLLGPYLLPHP